MIKKVLVIFLIVIALTSLAGCKHASDKLHTNNMKDDAESGSINDTESDTMNDVESGKEPAVKPNNFVVGMRIGEAFDLTAYNDILDELTNSPDVIMNLKDVLPFEAYVIVPNSSLVNAYEYYYEKDYGESKHSIMSDSILGERYSVMIVKMNDSDNYALLSRDPYNLESLTCTFTDFSNYRIVAVDLTQEDVETMVFPDRPCIKDEYLEKLLKQYRIASKEIDMLSEYIASQLGTPRYFVHNFETGELEELRQDNLAILAISNAVFVYFGDNPIPMPHEYLVHVNTYYDDTIKSYTLSQIIEEIQTYELIAYESTEIVDDGFSSFDEHPVASQDIIDELIEIGFPADQLDFSYKKWIDSSNFPDDMCTDVGLLWILSLINDEISGDLLTRGKILNEKELLQELKVQALPHTNMVGIVNHDTLNYCIIVRVHNETSLIERANVESVFEVLSAYRQSLQVDETESEESAKRGTITVGAAGPYVWLISLGETQGFDDYWEAVTYHYEQYNKAFRRFEFLFDYLRALSLKNQNAGHTSYDNYWN